MLAFCKLQRYFLKMESIRRKVGMRLAKNMSRSWVQVLGKEQPVL